MWTSFALDTDDRRPARRRHQSCRPICRSTCGRATISTPIRSSRSTSRTGKLRWHRQLVPNDSHDWDVTHATPIFTTTINGATRRLVATAGKDGMLRALDRDTHAVVYETPVTTRENAETPVITSPLRACPGVLGGSQWNGPAYNPRHEPALRAGGRLVRDVLVVRAGPLHSRQAVHGRHDAISIRRRKAQGWLTAVDASTGAVKWKYRSPRPMVAAVTTDRRQPGAHRRADRRFRRVRRAQRRRALPLQHRRTDRRRHRHLRGRTARQYIAVASGSPSNFWVETPSASLEAGRGRGVGAPTVVVFALPRDK